MKVLGVVNTAMSYVGFRASIAERKSQHVYEAKPKYCLDAVVVINVSRFQPETISLTANCL